MRIFSWLKSFFSNNAVAKQISSLAEAAAPVIQEVERVKQAYKEADGLNEKNSIVISYVKEKDAISVNVADQLIYCPAAVLWTELAVIGLKAIYPQATGYYLRCAITLAYAYFAVKQEQSQQEVAR